MTVNAAYRCTHGTVRTLVTMDILGTVGILGILGKMGARRIKLSINNGIYSYSFLWSNTNMIINI